MSATTASLVHVIGASGRAHQIASHRLANMMGEHGLFLLRRD